jgi:hypothetical protein
MAEVRSSPGCGLGLFARCALPAGAEIVRESPLVVMQYQPVTTKPRDALFATAPLAAAAFKDAPKVAKKVALRLDDRFARQTGKPPSPLGIFTTSEISLEKSTLESCAGHRGLFALASRVNHACKPNARLIWRDDLHKELLLAVRPIQKGEESTVSYDEDLCMEQARRRLSLHERFDFWCACEECESRRRKPKPYPRGPGADRAFETDGLSLHERFDFWCACEECETCRATPQTEALSSRTNR